MKSKVSIDTLKIYWNREADFLLYLGYPLLGVKEPERLFKKKKITFK